MPRRVDPPRGTRGAGPPIDERSFHAWLSRTLPAGRGGLLPLGDDAAAVRGPRGAAAVLTTDALVEGTHFLADSPPERIGRAAAAVSASDAAAKGAAPAALLIALLLPPGSPRAWAEAVTRGAERGARDAGAELVGGDTKPAPIRAVVSSLLAWAPPRRLAPRTGARPGDLLVTTGTVGRGGAAAYRLARAGAGTARRAALGAMLDVRPRVREGRRLAGRARAMLDTSDGIADAARLLAAASRVAVVVEREALPVDPAAAALPGAAREAALVFGGDYELLAAVPAASLDAATRAVRAAGGRLTRIGRVERGAGAWLETAGTDRRPMPPGGWRPFGRGRSPHR